MHPYEINFDEDLVADEIHKLHELHARWAAEVQSQCPRCGAPDAQPSDPLTLPHVLDKLLADIQRML